ncbi:MAG: cyclodeaminase/cyclohydrolase family protein [Calditrichia bacterium]
MIKDYTIEKILEEVSSGTPVPGGGSVSCLAAALSASLVSMVCNLTLGRKRYQKYEVEVKKILETSCKLREEFLLLAEKDTEVFSEVMKAYHLPQTTEEEKLARKKAVEEATKRAALVPMDVLRRCETLGEQCLSIAAKGNENSINDAGMAAIMAYAAAQGASFNIMINLSTISDEDFVSKLKTEQARVLKIVKDLYCETKQLVEKKI